MNRLGSITETGGATNWNRAYAYDAFGNRAATGQNVFANTPQSVSDFNAANNRLTAPWASYDPAGNLSAFLKLGFEWSAGYDANNLQRFYCAATTAACTAANASAQYQYDGDGRRVKKLQGARTTVFVYDAFGDLAAEYDTQPDPNLAAGTYYRTTDHLGSTRLVTDGNGAVVSPRLLPLWGRDTRQLHVRQPPPRHRRRPSHNLQPGVRSLPEVYWKGTR